MSLFIEPIRGIPEVDPGDDLGGLLVGAIRAGALVPRDRDVVVVTQKVVSKSEGRVVPEEPDGKAAWVERETRRVVARRGDLVIAETRHGLICANAGVDASNIGSGSLTLLPQDPDASAARLRDLLEAAFGVSLAVVITDTFGRPWRNGVVNVAIGCAGMPPLVDLRGTMDASGRVLEATVVALADEIAAASGLVMGKGERVPAVLVRGLRWEAPNAPASALIRPRDEDLFRESPLQAVAATGNEVSSPHASVEAPGDAFASATPDAEAASKRSLGQDAARVTYSAGPDEDASPSRAVVVVSAEGIGRQGSLAAEALVGAAAQAYRIALRAQGFASAFVPSSRGTAPEGGPAKIAIAVWPDPELRRTAGRLREPASGQA